MERFLDQLAEALPVAVGVLLGWLVNSSAGRREEHRWRQERLDQSLPAARQAVQAVHDALARIREANAMMQFRLRFMLSLPDSADDQDEIVEAAGTARQMLDALAIEHPDGDVQQAAAATIETLDGAVNRIRGDLYLAGLDPKGDPDDVVSSDEAQQERRELLDALNGSLRDLRDSVRATSGAATNRRRLRGLRRSDGDVQQRYGGAS